MQGFRVGALGHLASHFDVILGYAYLNGIVTNSIVNASPFGSLCKANDPVFGIYPYFISPNNFPLANVPRNSGNLWVTHESAVAVCRRIRRQLRGASSRKLDSDECGSAEQRSNCDYRCPSGIQGDEWLLDLQRDAAQAYQRPVGVQANLINLTNKFYIDQPHPNHLIPGEGFNAQFGFNAHF